MNNARSRSEDVPLQVEYHYPPELFQLLVDTIPRLCRSKRDVLIFFRGAGVKTYMLAELEERLARDGLQHQ